MIKFLSALSLSRGQLYKIISESYKELSEDTSGVWKDEKQKWDNFDKLVFDYPETIGKCLFVTWENNKIVGLASWDPRSGEIGQNCVLPAFRNRGLGRKQMEEVIKRLKELPLSKAMVTTSQHPFFKPALKMYKSMGFIVINRRKGGPDPRYGLVDLEYSFDPKLGHIG